MWGGGEEGEDFIAPITPYLDPHRLTLSHLLISVVPLAEAIAKELQHTGANIDTVKVMIISVDILSI